MDYITILGLIATTLTTGSSLPQIIQILKTKKTRDLSLPMYAALCSGILLWVAYGFLRGDAVLVIANAVGLALYGSILGFKLRYG